MPIAATPIKPELLAPAGSLEAFFAAMEKGADAVYVGLKEFSARAKAKNFSLGQLERMVAYAHSLGRKVYVTLNTLVKERELPQLVETLSALEAMNVDAVIVQDLAVARLVRNFFPGIPLHASTQMTIHNSLGVQQLADLGFERVVLARELHLDEIRDIVRKSSIGIECFIHGALCFSISGQCYFSSFLGGHSGNRGRCAQPCRRQYTYKGKEGYYFSTNDFSSIDLLPELYDAGIASLKIEGRMKSAEYVASVVGAYRMVLDASAHRKTAAVAEAKELLKLSFGRVPTKGFLASQAPTDIATPSLKGATGRFLGEIRSVRDGAITFETRDRLHVGDRIRVQPKTDMAGRAFTIKELAAGKQQVKSVKEKTVVTTISPFSCKVGDSVFKVSSETAFTMSENACLRKLETVRTGKVPCDLRVGLAGESLSIAATVGGEEYIFSFPLGELEPARTTDMEGVLRSQFTRTGDTPFELRSFAAPGVPAVLIPAAHFKNVRRDFYRQLEESSLRTLKERRRQVMQRALANLATALPERSAPRSELCVRIEYLRDWPILRHEGVDFLSVPVSKANLHQLPLLARKLQGREERVSWRLPFMIFEEQLPFFREAVRTIAAHGFRRFEAANLSHFALLAGQGLQVATDYRLFSLNSEALRSWRDLGAEAATFYIEDDAENMADLLRADVAMARRVVVYCGVPAITTKIAIRSVKNDAPVVSDRGEQYEVTTKDGLTVVTPVTRFSLTGHRARLQAMGCGSFIIDLGQQQKDEWPKIISTFNRGAALPGTSEFNFQMGLV